MASLNNTIILSIYKARILVTKKYCTSHQIKYKRVAGSKSPTVLRAGTKRWVLRLI